MVSSLYCQLLLAVGPALEHGWSTGFTLLEKINSSPRSCQAPPTVQPVVRFHAHVPASMLGLLAWAFKGLVYVAIITMILTCTCLLMSRKQFPWSPPRPFYAILKFPKPSGVVVGDNDIMSHLGLSMHSLLSLQVGRSGSPLISIFHICVNFHLPQEGGSLMCIERCPDLWV